MLQVKNFEKFQHYRDRAPIWIKLYGSLLEDYEFNLLPDVAKAHLILIWLLASRMGNQIPDNADWIRARIGAIEPVDLALLIRSGFLIDTASNGHAHSEQVASKMLHNAEQYRSDTLHITENGASPEKRREREREENRQQQSNCHSFAAAAQKEEEHKSAFSPSEVRRYVEATKPHATNPGGLARSIWRSGEEDLEIRKWIDAEEQKERIRSAVLVGPNDDFDFSGYIEGLISRGDLAQLQNEREGIESRGGPQADWEKRVFDYFNRAAEGNSAA